MLTNLMDLQLLSFGFTKSLSESTPYVKSLNAKF